jgi:hypothetical protein
VLLEKNGRCVALVDEPLALSGSEDLVTDIVDRLSSLGWRPLVAWRDAPREPDELNRLLDAHAVPLPREDPIRILVEGLELSRPATQSQEGILSDDPPAEHVPEPIRANGRGAPTNVPLFDKHVRALPGSISQ